jgi:hypothetical protein
MEKANSFSLCTLFYSWISWGAAAAALVALGGCVTQQTKLDEAAKANSTALEKGYAKGPKEAVAAEIKKCRPPENMKWDLHLSAEGPFIQQKTETGSAAYGAYQVICFKIPHDGKNKLKLLTTHQGGGYSKAYYVLPALALYGSSLKPTTLAPETPFKQDAWSGDYHTELTFETKANETYYLIVAADNSHPERSWNQYANPGLGYALQGVFPVEVRSSPYGVVKIEIVPL